MTPDNATTDQYATIECNGDVVTATLVGPTLGEHEGAVISYMLRDAIDNAPGVRAVVLDFAQVSFINSAMIGACVTIRNAAEAAGAQTVLYAMAREIEAVFKLCKFNKLFAIARDEKQLAKFTKAG